MRHLSENHKKRLGESHNGNCHTAKTKDNISKSLKGKKLSSKTKTKISKSLIGNQHMLGKKHSLETKRKMSEGHKGFKHSKEAIAKISIAKIGNKNSLGHKHSLETRRKISKTIRKKYASGKRKISENCFSFANRGEFYSIKNKKWILYRSSYELIVYQLLEQMQMVVKYEAEPFSIPYRKGYDNVRNYFPDLLIYYKDWSRELIEIKPLRFVSDSRNQKKFRAAENFCEQRDMNFSIWSENEIFKHQLRRPVVQ